MSEVISTATETSAPAEADPATEGTETVEQDGAEVDAQLEQFLSTEPDEDDPAAMDAELAEHIDPDKEVTEGEKPAEQKKPPEQAEARKFKVKVDGQELEVDEKELVTGYQRAAAANKKFEQAAALQKSMTAFVEKLRADPLSVLTDQRLGLNFREVAEKFLIDQLQQEQMTPEQRELHDARKKLTAYEESQKKQREAQEAAELEQRTNEWAQQIEKQFSESIKKVGVPLNERTISLMAQLAEQAENENEVRSQRGLPPLEYNSDLLADAVKRYLAQEKRQLLESMDPDEMRAFLGKERLDKIRQADVARARAGQPARPKAVPQASAKPKTDRHYVTEEELDQSVGKRVGRYR